MTTHVRGQVAEARVRSASLPRAWLWTAVAGAAIVVGMVFGPGEGGSVLLLVGVLALIVLGLAALAVAFTHGLRGVKQGRMLAILPLLVDCVLLFWGLVGILGTFGRYLGWDA
jgi:hypothetical protein